MSEASGKKPVLTSPWKIGMFVSLLLLVVGFGVGYYLVNVYDVDLKWLMAGTDRWGIDSYLLFREIYPLAGGIILVSLLSYFIISSAVRRYKFYLDSGQDYRRMISLAESIDDLTNPSQIAKLSNYPELQSVLRNYGNQIREISQEIQQKEKESRSIDLEMEIESLLKGDSVNETLVDDKWWTPLFRKIQEHIERSVKSIKRLEERSKFSQNILNRTALSHGKLLESIGGSSEDLLEIVRAVGELNSVAKQLDVSSPGAPDEGAHLQGNMLGAVVKEMEGSLRKLEDGGHMLHKFADDNNGLALNMALTAAKSKVDNNILAQFAEKVRSTAELFNRLSGNISGVTQDLLGHCHVLKGKVGSGIIAGTGGANSQFQQPISEISHRIEDRSKLLQQKICNLGGELQDIHELLQESLKKIVSPEGELEIVGEFGSTGEELQVDGKGLVNFGADSDIGLDEDSDLLINHGSMWEEGGGFEFSGETAVGPSESSVSQEVVPPEDGKVKLGDINDEGQTASSPLIFEEEPAASKDSWKGQIGSQQDKQGTGGGLIEMPGHKWVKVNVKEAEQGMDKGPVDVEVRDEQGIEGENLQTVTKAAAGSEKAGDGEPIYDLYELGAVEYVEETKV